jgi:hypothetical protein
MTNAQLTALLDSYLAAEKKVLAGQAVEHDGKRITRANLSELVAERKALEARLAVNGRRKHALASFS